MRIKKKVKCRLCQFLITLGFVGSLASALFTSLKLEYSFLGLLIVSFVTFAFSYCSITIKEK